MLHIGIEICFVLFCLRFDMGKFSGNFVQQSFLAPFLYEMDFSALKGDGLDSRHAHQLHANFYWLFYVVNLCSYGTSEVYSKYLYGLGSKILKFFT